MFSELEGHHDSGRAKRGNAKQRAEDICGLTADSLIPELPKRMALPAGKRLAFGLACVVLNALVGLLNLVLERFDAGQKVAVLFL